MLALIYAASLLLPIVLALSSPMSSKLRSGKRRRPLASTLEEIRLRVPAKINASIFQAEAAYCRLLTTKIEAFIFAGALNDMLEAMLEIKRVEDLGVGFDAFAED